MLLFNSLRLSCRSYHSFQHSWFVVFGFFCKENSIKEWNILASESSGWFEAVSVDLSQMCRGPVDPDPSILQVEVAELCQSRSVCQISVNYRVKS